MKRITPLVGSLISLLLTGMSFTPVEHTGNIHVIVTGIDSSKGQIGILLFESKGGFPEDYEAAKQMALVPFTGKEVKYTFTDIPYGKYAISVMHDANMNKELDTNFFGIPEEGFGVSNNAKAIFSAPKFEDASFELDDENLTKTIELNY